MTKLNLAGAALTVLVATVLGACTPPAPPAASVKPPVDTAAIAAAIKADEAQLVLAYNAHDADKMSAHDAGDVVQMAHGGPNIVGASADSAMTKSNMQADPTSRVTVANESVDVPASGEMAVYHATYVATFKNPKTKKQVTENGNYLAGYKQQADGSWKIQWSIISDTGPPPPPAKPAKSVAPSAKPPG